MRRYKFLRTGLKSEYGDFTWEIGKWYKTQGELELCGNGFHCSKQIGEAFSYVKGEYLAEVEVRGKHLSSNDKEVWEEMRVKKVFQWRKENSVELAIFSAELVIDNYEKQYPNDDRPRKAIEAAKKYLENSSEKNKSAAWSAARSAAESVESAWSAWSAESAWSAWSAWSAAWSAARSAAESARSAAESARSAAKSAAYKKIYDKFNKISETLLQVTPETIIKLNKNEIIVFGSNKDGKHDGGLAKVCVDKFGAIYGQGKGLQGQSYAIDTMGTYKEMQKQVNDFIKFAEQNPDKKFFVTRIGTGIAGKDEQKIIKMFSKQPKNVTLPLGWEFRLN